MKCELCPRMCLADRKISVGFCGEGEEIKCARAALHFGEEPPISGEKGSGTVFFSGCSLRCVYCQNREISREGKGKAVSSERLSEIFLELQEKGAENINLVTACHFAPFVVKALERAKLSIPVVYNTSGYERAETLKLFDGLVDVFLPDYKYVSRECGKKYSFAENYSDVILPALSEMRRQQGEDIFDERGIMKKGMIIRHLVLPKNTNQSLKILDSIKENFGTETYISLMSQYTPLFENEALPELNRRITKREYEKVVNYALNLGFSNMFLQDYSSCGEEFIPNFDFSGV